MTLVATIISSTYSQMLQYVPMVQLPNHAQRAGMDRSMLLSLWPVQEWLLNLAVYAQTRAQ